MKTVLIAVLLLSLNVFAAPEDHLQNQVCYDLKLRQGQTYRPQEVPENVCVEQVQIDVNLTKIYIESYFQSQLFQNLKLKSLIRQTEDSYHYEAESVYVSDWQSACGDGTEATLKISGDSDFNGYVNPASLKVTVTYEHTNDTCHSDPREQQFDYTLRF